MSKLDKGGLLPNLKYDFPAGIVVFLVALPLCLGIALASGAPLFSGIISGIVGGILVGLLSKSQLGVSGPAAGLAAIVFAAIPELGGFQVFLAAVVIAGVLQVLMGVLKAGVIGYYFPISVIKGMLSGIGIVIFLKQIPHAFGYDKDPEGDLDFAQLDGQNTFSELVNMLDYVSPSAMIITAVCLILLILWERPFIKNSKYLQYIQGPLVAVVVGALLNVLFAKINWNPLSDDHLVRIPIPETAEGYKNLFMLPDFSAFTKGKVWVVGATLAIVASLETLLCVEATDKLDPYKRITPANRELLAQGAGNIVAGFIGGLPLTQVIVRSSANIQSGGRTKYGAVYHGFMLLIAAFTIPWLLNLIPLASLAAILLVIGYKLAKPALFKEMYNRGIWQFIPYVATIVVMVFKDLLWGVGVGLVIAIIQILWENFDRPYKLAKTNGSDDGVIRINLAENVSFLNKPRIMNSLNELPEGSKVIVDTKKSIYIHPDVVEMLIDFRKTAETKGIDYTFIDFHGLDKKKRPLDELKRVLKRNGNDSQD